MPPQARIGDASQVSADAHGCPGCPHSAIGPAISGSPNVMVNGRPAVRVGDTGIHSACCGENTWAAKTGSRSVFINGRPAHRLGDMVMHCGGYGKTIQGSSNVLIGDSTGQPKSHAEEHLPFPRQFEGGFIIVDRRTGDLVKSFPYRITRTSGPVITGVTDDHGQTIIVGSDQIENLLLEVVDNDL